MRSRLRSGRLGGTQDELGEDVNPSAYIVNLADCMLVLACGFLVALISFWQIDISGSLSDDDLERVEADVVPEDVVGAGSNYVEAGTVYMDPSTGDFYILRQNGTDSQSGTGDESASSESALSESVESEETASSESGGADASGTTESTATESSGA